MQPTDLTPEEAAPAPAAAVAKAGAAIEKYGAWIFWMRNDEAQLQSVADVRLVIRRLRENGDRETWFVAREIERCL